MERNDARLTSRREPPERDGQEADALAAASGAHKPDTSAKDTRRKRRPLDAGGRDPYIRAENEDDDGYDPYSDRTAGPEPLFERDPWN